MKRVAGVLLFLTACATSQISDSARLKQIADEYWQHELDESVALQVKFGLPTKHLPDVSYAHAKKEAEYARTLVQRLDAIRADRLTADERVTLAILRWENQLQIDGLPYFWYRFQVAPYTFQFTSIATLFRQKLSDADRTRLVAEVPRFADQLVEVLKEEQRRGIVMPKAEIAQVKQNLTALTSLMPELSRVVDFVSSQESAAPTAIGVSQYPGGDAAYRFFIRERTTVDMTPQQIHDLGLREVARIDGELESIRQTIGFQGSKADFDRFLRTDSRFFVTTPDEVGERLTKYMHRIEPHLPELFANFPKAQYNVKRLDPALEGSITFGYYQQPTATDAVGHYFYNGSKLSERNLLFAPALIAHELVPGHHFQIVRQEENESLPSFRREHFDTAFIEGWGEYAAYLGNEMHLYDDPYDRCGRLMMDKMLSVRLVVDTGMNALGWSRERAADYLRANTLLSDTEISTETLRYAVDLPAQALAYKIGSLKMIELRRKAEQQLGAKFDVRQFHEWIIGSGSMPLPILEQHLADAMQH